VQSHAGRKQGFPLTVKQRWFFWFKLKNGEMKRPRNTRLDREWRDQGEFSERQENGMESQFETGRLRKKEQKDQRLPTGARNPKHDDGGTGARLRKRNKKRDTLRRGRRKGGRS
jgi:hypothetical protein